MRYADVSVHSPAARRQTFSYRVPAGLSVAPGQAVWVPFGARTLQGIVTALTALPGVDADKVRDITGVIDPRPLVSGAQLELAHWINEYYLTPLAGALGLMLPPGFERKSVTFLALTPQPADYDPAALIPAAQELLDLLRPQGELRQVDAEEQLGKMKTRRALKQLIEWDLVQRRYTLTPPGVGPKQVPYIYLELDAAAAEEQVAVRRHRAPKQAALLEYLIRQGTAVALSRVRAESGAGDATVKTMLQRGDIGRRLAGEARVPPELATPGTHPAVELTAAQRSAVAEVSASLAAAPDQKPRVLLLEGVTASGKTEVYIQALAAAVKLGQRAIVLVPEISLTPQTIERFTARFPGRVAVIHSRLTPGEQYDEWHRIRDGAVDVVIGPRSALFAPQPDLGLVVIDEEHEWSYKQQDQAPPYHAREVARKLADINGLTLLLGSATPDVVSHHRAVRGRYQLLTLPDRVTPQSEKLPEISVVDMRRELKAGNLGIFSRELREALHQTLDAGDKAILFLNRRGGASFVQCRSCGHLFRCRRCAVALTHHPDSDRLICHQCHYQRRLPDVCPTCGSHHLDYLGAGTQKLEREAACEFPSARLLRWDSDTTTGRHAHREILEQFRGGGADILIGTQMLAKGLDLPEVTLVGVVSADTTLNLPDYRAGERTFQLLTQVAGRAGRGDRPGRVVIQTYAPEHYAVRAAAAHDYEGFYAREIEHRRKLGNPPFSQLCRLIFSHRGEAFAAEEARRLRQALDQEIASRGLEGISVIGPAPAFITRRRSRYRWVLLLRGVRVQRLLQNIALPRGWTVNVDPLGLA